MTDMKDYTDAMVNVMLLAPLSCGSVIVLERHILGG